jgi:glutamyl-tRNA reductase
LAENTKNSVLFCVGTNHESAGLDFRESLFLSRDEINHALPPLIQKHALCEVLVLSTCNRLEIYGVVETLELTPHHIKDIFIDLQRFCPVPKAELDEEIKNRSYSHMHKDAARHAFSVASGLDSLVLGETQIAGQFKDAAQFAAEGHTLGPILMRMTQEAFATSKKVRTNTDIGKKPVSISHAAIDLANRVYGQLKNCRVLVIGAGEMAEIAAKYLLKYSPKQVFICNRTLTRAENLVQKVGIGIAYPWEELNEVLPLADVVISCTGANEIVLDKARIQRSQNKRNRRASFFIDIALPRDIDPKITELEDVYLFDIDDLKQVVGENFEERKKAAELGRAIIIESVETFDRWLATRTFKPTLATFRDYLEGLVAQEMQKSLSKSPLNTLSHQQGKALEAMMKSIVSKMAGDVGRAVHNPTEVFDSLDLTEALKILFTLDKTS